MSILSLGRQLVLDLTVLERLNGKQTRTHLRVHNLSAQDLVDLLREKLDPKAALDDALTRLRAPNGSSNGNGRNGRWTKTPEGRERMREAAKARWARMSPAKRRAIIRAMHEARYGKARTKETV